MTCAKVLFILLCTASLLFTAFYATTKLTSLNLNFFSAELTLLNLTATNINTESGYTESLPLLHNQPLDYVIALNFNEQLESGMYDLYQLADITHSWNFRLVEPHVIKSHFRFPVLPTHQLLRFSDVYNLTDLNNNLRTSLAAKYDVIAPLREVADGLTAASYTVVVLYLLPYQLSVSTCISSRRDQAAGFIKSVYLHAKRYRQELASRTIVCLNVRKDINFRTLLTSQPTLKLAYNQSSMSRSRMLILIPEWNGIRNYKDKFFYWDSNFHPFGYKYVHAINHSELVLNATALFKESLQVKPPTLGIHIRLERLIRSESFTKKDISKCIERMVAKIESLQRGGIIKSSIAFRDYGKFGSKTCKKVQCYEFSKEFQLDEKLRRLGVKVKEFNSQFTEFPYHSGFYSNVEQEMLSRSDFLLTVGYGSFQSSLVERYMRRIENVHHQTHEELQKRIFKICHL